MVKYYYKMVRMPIEAHKEAEAIKKKMEQRIKAWTGKEVNVSMANVYREVMRSKKEIPEVNVIKYAKKKKK